MGLFDRFKTKRTAHTTPTAPTSQQIKEAWERLGVNCKEEMNWMDLWTEFDRNMAQENGLDETLHFLNFRAATRPQVATAWASFGVACAKKAGSYYEYQEAIRWYDKALAIKPKMAIVWYEKGLVLAALERYREAIPCIATAIQLYPPLVKKEVLESALRNPSAYDDFEY
jgi:tetratricopeptide (TPR) repeat protein